MKKPLILFVNGGRTDLQVLIQEDDKHYRVETSKEQLRFFHQALLDNRDDSNRGLPYQIVHEEVRKHRDYDAIWENEQLRLKKWGKKSSDSEQTAKIITNEQGTIQLVPAKLLGVVDALKEDYQVVKAVVFYTERPNDKQEPIAVGKILGDWLRSQFGLHEQDVSVVNILPNRRKIEGPDARDYPVNRETVQIIDQTVRDLAKANQDCMACVSAAGMQDVKNLIKACVRFHFSPAQERFIEMEVKERGENQPVKIEQVPTAVDSFHAREHAIALIRHGDFIGAYGAVAHLKNDEKERFWVKKVQDAANYFTGILSDRFNLEPYLKTLIKQRPRCLLVAMRLEAALRAQRVPEAIGWTCTFLDDAAMLDLIQKVYRLDNSDFDESNRIIDFSSGKSPHGNLIGNNGYPLQAEKIRQKYKYLITKRNRNNWFECLKADAPNLNIQAFEAYSKALETKVPINSQNGDTTTPDKLRNLNTHSILTRDQIRNVQRIFTAVNLWNKDRFLIQPLAKNILSTLGVQDATKLYSELVEGLCQSLINPA